MGNILHAHCRKKAIFCYKNIDCCMVWVKNWTIFKLFPVWPNGWRQSVRLCFVDKQAFLAKQNNDMFESSHWKFSRGHNPWFWSEKEIFKPRTYTQIHTPVVQGRGGRRAGEMEPFPRVFDMLQYFEIILASVKACDLLNKLRYILRVVALLEVFNISNNGHHLGCHLFRDFTKY